MAEYLFVYGTLRSESNVPMRHVFAQGSEYVAGAFMQGRLYEVDGYPGAVESDNPQERVAGELYRIRDRTVLEQMDIYEECSPAHPGPHEYTRKKVDVHLATGEKLSVWAYLFNRDVAALQRIESGDYAGFLKQAAAEG